MATVLVVDDRVENRSLLVSLLGYAGHRVVEARNGIEALDLARADPPALVITDLLMPAMDGFELARRLRADPLLADVRIVFFTATYVQADARALASACGVRHILTKPAEPEEILRVVSEELAGSGPAAVPTTAIDFQQEHLRLLTMTLAHKAEVVVPRLNAIMALSLQLASELDPVRLLETFCAGVSRALEGEFALVALVRRIHAEDGALFTSGLDGHRPPDWAPRGAAADAMAQRRALCATAAEADAGLPPGLPSALSFVFAPIQSPDSVYGCVCIARSAATFSQEETDLAGTLGGLVGRIYENGSLYAAARRQAEELASSEQRFRQLAENIPEVFWIATIDPERALYVSPAYETVWGRSLASFNERPESWLDAVVPEDVAVAQSFWERSRLGETTAEEFRITRPDGSVRWLWARCFPVHDEQGRLERLTGVTLDITDRHALDQQFRQAQKMEAVGRLAGGVAHDFNNLVGVVMGYGESALRMLPEEHPVRPKLDQILKAAERAAGITRQLLLFSRKHVAERTLLDLNAVIRDMERILHRLVGEDLEMDVQCASQGAIRADIREIEQVLMNLVVNARDALPQGGRLAIATADERVVEGAAPALQGVPPGDYVRLTVVDDGVGIPLEIQQQIFEPFFTTKGPDRGTGLGLSTVYGIVKQVKGHILLHSEPGHGATFTLYFPRMAGLAEVRVKPVDSIPRGEGTVLLVEDDRALRSVTREMLEECGYSVLEAGSGAEALRLAESQPGAIDLLLTDVVMPGFNGPETAARVRAVRPGIKVLFVSGYSGSEMVNQGVLVQNQALLQKPYTMGEMARKVRETLDA